MSRVYVSPDSVEAFVGGFRRFSEGRVVSDEPKQGPRRRDRLAGRHLPAPAPDLGFRPPDRAGDRRPPALPDGHETAGYEVADTLAKATSAGASVLVAPVPAGDRIAAMVRFPGGYVAEIHQAGAAAR